MSSLSSLRAARPCLLMSPVCPTTCTAASPVCLVYWPTARVSLTVASTRPCLSSWMACTKPSTASTLQPASEATLLQLLVEDCAQVLPRRSGRPLIERSSERATMTPSEVVYGRDSEYLA